MPLVWALDLGLRISYSHKIGYPQKGYSMSLQEVHLSKEMMGPPAIIQDVRQSGEPVLVRLERHH